jgi:hypothetical protein
VVPVLAKKEGLQLGLAEPAPSGDPARERQNGVKEPEPSRQRKRKAVFRIDEFSPKLRDLESQSWKQEQVGDVNPNGPKDGTIKLDWPSAGHGSKREAFQPEVEPVSAKLGFKIGGKRERKEVSAKQQRLSGASAGAERHRGPM